MNPFLWQFATVPSSIAVDTVETRDSAAADHPN
jgi:hypothetical protein